MVCGACVTNIHHVCIYPYRSPYFVNTERKDKGRLIAELEQRLEEQKEEARKQTSLYSVSKEQLTQAQSRIEDISAEVRTCLCCAHDPIREVFATICVTHLHASFFSTCAAMLIVISA